MSNYNKDVDTDKIIADFLDDHFYSKCEDVDCFDRVETEEKQRKGIDVVLNLNGNSYNVDEKASAHYIDQNLPTFALEIDFLNSYGTVTNGWFIKDGLSTDAYFFNYISSEDGNGEIYQQEDIQEIEMVFLQKDKLVNFWEKKGLNKECLKRAAIEIRERDDDGRVYANDLITFNDVDKNIYFYYTKELAEQPINLITNKNDLIDLSDFHFIVGKQEIEKV